MVETKKENKIHQLIYSEYFQEIALLGKDLFTQWSYFKISTCSKSPSLKCCTFKMKCFMLY